MTDNNGDANDKATGNGGDAGAGTGNERDKWSRSDWERFHQSESDRRVTEALKKKEEDYKTLLENTTATADEKLKAYETQLSEERTRAEFMSLANSKGVADPKAAWAVVKQSELTDGKGKIDFDELKKNYPSLFGGNGGVQSVAGKQSTTTNGKTDMNQILRNAVKG